MAPLVLNPALHPGDLLDLEVSFRDALDSMLDGEEMHKNLREMGHEIIAELLGHLMTGDIAPRDALLEFSARTTTLLESATIHQKRVRVTSAHCLLEMWARRTNILDPAFQRVLNAFKELATPMPQPDLFLYTCFKALVGCWWVLTPAWSWPGIYRR